MRNFEENNLVSRGTLSELVRASVEKFERMIKDVPLIERKFVLKSFQKYAQILGDVY
jgi:hypothetical protein